MTTDPGTLSAEALLAAELQSVYAQLDHLAAVAQALYVGTGMILEALEAGTSLADLSPVTREQLRLALRQAKVELRMAECSPTLEEMREEPTP